MWRFNAGGVGLILNCLPRIPLLRTHGYPLETSRKRQTLQVTALVHEAYLRLVSKDDPQWDGRRHFIGAAAEVMRRILVENARRKSRLKRGGQLERVDVEAVELPSPMLDEDLLAVNDALDSLEKADLHAARSGGLLAA
ncbi:MAG TPA: ECF-type sigma factor [Verrucomicrobiae bacterium]